MQTKSLIGALLVCLGCSAEDAPPGSNTGGGNASGSGAASGSGGSAAGGSSNVGGTGNVPTSGGTGGSSGTGAVSGSGGSGGAGFGGASGSGGSATGGAGTGATGGGGGTGGLGGSSGSGGSGGATGGTGGGGTGGMPAQPSAGCGKSGRPTNGLVTVNGSHIYWFPESYDGSTPMPLIMAFHAAGNQNTQLRNITQNSALADHFVMAFPKSQGNGWNPGVDGQSINQRFSELLDDYCIDESRVFATGHSSGAQLIVQLMCSGDDRFRAIAPVASSAYCQSWDDPIPALIIHGADDRERANTNQDADGRKDLAPYLASNDCSMTTAPYEQMGCSSSGTQVNPNCVEYQGCSEQTIWCQHNDPQYSSTNHGWPCFANDAIDRFFSRF